MAMTATSAQVFRLGTTSSPPCTSSSSSRAPLARHSSSLPSPSEASYAGRSLRTGWSRQGMQSSATERIAAGFLSASSAGRISAFGRDDDGPLYFVGDGYGGAADGPIELPPREIEIDPFAIPEASPAQIVASVALTGAIVFLSYRALRRRAARSKEMTFRSSGISQAKSIKEEASKTVIGNLTKVPEIRTPPPSPAQTFFGAVVAGGIALVLYNFTTGVESGFSVKAVSQDYSIRNLTITVRTIITGLCYLATFVFAANSIGLTLYAFQLLLGIGVADPPAPPTDSVQEEESKAELETEDLSEN